VSFIAAVRRVNTALDGEVVGPHLWPHGFDIATEWFSERLVDYNGDVTNAQIGIGWYPTDGSYVYASPWPFREEFVDIPLPAGAVWHRNGWEGAKLDVPDGTAITTDDVIALAATVHTGTRSLLGT
jgi:hypothetical protein